MKRNMICVIIRIPGRDVDMRIATMGNQYLYMLRRKKEKIQGCSTLLSPCLKETLCIPQLPG